MTNASKAKGTAAETAVVRYLRERGLLGAERRPLHGNKDQGDIAGVPNTVIEVKACAKLDLSGWLKEAHVEAANAGSDYGVVWHKRRGFTSAEQWYVTMDGGTFVDILEAGGFFAR